MIKFSPYPFFIQAALVVIVLMLITLVITYIYIVSIRLKSNSTERFRGKYEPAFRELLINEIIANDEQDINSFELTVNKFRKFDLTKRKVRAILVQNILHFRLQFSGKTNEALRQLYIELNLHRDALNTLNYTDDNAVIMAIKELTFMDIYKEEIGSEKFLQHQNQYVREISRRYVIVMRDSGVTDVFDSITESISGIEKLELFQVITELKMARIPDFSSWIKEDQPYSLVSLCLKLVVYFQQYDCISTIIKLLETENNALKRDAINSLGKLLQEESESSIVSVYDVHNEGVKIEIIKAIGRIGSGKQLNFLKSIFDHESSIELKKHAAKSIVNHGPSGEFLFNNIFEKASLDSRLILNHSSNKNIKY